MSEEEFEVPTAVIGNEESAKVFGSIFMPEEPGSTVPGDRVVTVAMSQYRVIIPPNYNYRDEAVTEPLGFATDWPSASHPRKPGIIGILMRDLPGSKSPKAMAGVIERIIEKMNLSFSENLRQVMFPMVSSFSLNKRGPPSERLLPIWLFPYWLRYGANDKIRRINTTGASFSSLGKSLAQFVASRPSGDERMDAVFNEGLWKRAIEGTISNLMTLDYFTEERFARVGAQLAEMENRVAEFLTAIQHEVRTLTLQQNACIQAQKEIQDFMEQNGHRKRKRKSEE